MGFFQNLLGVTPNEDVNKVDAAVAPYNYQGYAQPFDYFGLTTITRSQADLDLARRIPEFERVIIRQVGSEAWNKLPDQAKAGLISFAYNYGSIAKESLRDAIKTGNLNLIADTLVQSTLNDNQRLSASTRNALKERRAYEAELIRSASPGILQAGFFNKQTAGLLLLAVAFTIFTQKS